jgi:hypothetical protein
VEKEKARCDYETLWRKRTDSMMFRRRICELEDRQGAQILGSRLSVEKKFACMKLDGGGKARVRGWVKEAKQG